MRRRDLLSALTLTPLAFAAAPRPKRVAAIVTEYRWYSHADVICGRLLGGHSANNRWTPSRLEMVSLYTAQVPKNDMSRDLAARHGFRIAPSIADAITNGTGRIAVDGVVFVGEHGDYPWNADGQHLYPRFELYSEILDVYEKNGRGVPTFFDKHFSYDWTKAKTMFDRSRKLGFPLMAGSSLPLTSRRPALQPALETPMTEAAAIGYGPLDAYGFHLLESLQCLVERRKGGETGLAEAEWIAGPDVFAWLGADRGAWARPLLASAWELDPASKGGASMEKAAKNPVLFRLRYRDGLQAAALMLGPAGNDRTVAIRVPGAPAPLRTLFGPPEVTRPLPHFDGLVHCMEEMIVSGKELYPPERTLLTTGALAFLFESKRQGRAVPTPVEVSYRSPREVFLQTA